MTRRLAENMLFIVLCGIGLASATEYAQAQCCDQTEDQKLTASNGASGDAFGNSLSVDAEVLIVGASGDDNAGGNAAGSAYVFRFDGANWIEEDQLLADDAGAFDFFGSSVAISGNLAVSGALGDDGITGSAYVFRFNGSMWSQEMKLTASDGASQDEFGHSVALSGEVAVIGAPNDDDGGLSSGSAYVYRFNPETQTWDEEQKLTASDATSFSQFGWSVSIDGNLIVAGARIEGAGDPGAAYVFRFEDGTWIEEQKLTASDATNNDNFGYSVSISQNAVVIGAPLGFGTDGGRAYVFRYDPVGQIWEEEQQLTGCDQATGDEVGWSVSISGDRIVVGARRDDDAGTDSGSAHVFCFGGSAWTQVAKLTAFDGAAGDHFGASVSISGNVAALGAPVDASNTGAMYVFEGFGSCACPADLNGDGAVGVKDLLFLLGAWGPCGDCDDCPADLVVDCDVGVKDLLFLLGAWGPCPCETGPPLASLQEAVEDAGLIWPADWDEFEDVMTDPLSSQAEKDNYICWMDHYLDHCQGPACPPPICPDDAPFGHHQ